MQPTAKCATSSRTADMSGGGVATEEKERQRGEGGEDRQRMSLLPCGGYDDSSWQCREQRRQEINAGGWAGGRPLALA